MLVTITIDPTNPADVAVGSALLADLKKRCDTTQTSATNAASSSPPSLQMEVLRLVAASPTGSATSYEVAKSLGMSQPDFAAKIRGTGKAAEQAQDVLYERGWTFENGKRVRVYTVTKAGLDVVEGMKRNQQSTTN